MVAGSQVIVPECCLTKAFKPLAWKQSWKRRIWKSFCPIAFRALGILVPRYRGDDMCVGEISNMFIVGSFPFSPLRVLKLKPLSILYPLSSPTQKSAHMIKKYSLKWKICPSDEEESPSHLIDFLENVLEDIEIVKTRGERGNRLISRFLSKLLCHKKIWNLGTESRKMKKKKLLQSSCHQSMICDTCGEETCLLSLTALQFLLPLSLDQISASPWTKVIHWTSEQNVENCHGKRSYIHHRINHLTHSRDLEPCQKLEEKKPFKTYGPSTALEKLFFFQPVLPPLPEDMFMFE